MVLGFDLVACILPLMFTGGLDSGFLLYALTPVMSAALMFRESVAFIASGLLSLSLLLSGDLSVMVLSCKSLGCPKVSVSSSLLLLMPPLAKSMAGISPAGSWLIILPEGAILSIS